MIKTGIWGTLWIILLSASFSLKDGSHMRGGDTIKKVVKNCKCSHIVRSPG